MTRAPRFEVLVSLAVLGLVLLFALAGLAVDGNMPKMLRVGAASLTYGAALVALLVRAGRLHAPSARLPWWPFAAAGALAGVVSGLVRPGIDLRLVLTGAFGGALLLGGVHWLGLRAWLRTTGRKACDRRIVA